MLLRSYCRLSLVTIHRENCTNLRNTTDDLDRLEAGYGMTYAGIQYYDGSCKLADSVYCSLYDSKPAQCRLNVRMNAAFVLMACLTAKAVYMVLVNLLARGKVKRHCLTIGDVIVASASDPDLRVQGYVTI